MYHDNVLENIKNFNNNNNIANYSVLFKSYDKIFFDEYFNVSHYNNKFKNAKNIVYSHKNLNFIPVAYKLFFCSFKMAQEKVRCVSFDDNSTKIFQKKTTMQTKRPY